MKIVHINIFDSVGSTGSIINSIIEECDIVGIESYLIFGRGKKSKRNNVIKAAPEMIMKLQSLRSKISGLPYGGCICSTRNIIRQLERIDPDIVHLHSINGYTVNIPVLLSYLKDKGIYTVITLHAEFMYTANCSHAYECRKWITCCNNCNKLKPERPRAFFFDRCTDSWNSFYNSYKDFEKLSIVAVSPWVKERAQQSMFFTGHDIKVILNGVDTKVFHPVDRKKEDNKEKQILYLTPDFKDELKGGRYVLKLAEAMKAEPYKILMVGNNIPDNLPGNVSKIPYVGSKQELAMLYQNADVTLLTSKAETFSMVVAESICCGTPVVGFKAGGPESIVISGCGEFITYSDVNGLKQMVKKYSELRCNANVAVGRYDKRVMARQYLNLYREIFLSGEV